MTVELENPFMHTAGLTLVFLGFGIVVARVVDWKGGRFSGVFLKPLARMGFYSYSIYLWHTVVCEWFLWKNSALAFWAYLVTAIAVGIAAATLIELPALALREKLFPSDASISSTIPELDGTLAVAVPSA